MEEAGELTRLGPGRGRGTKYAATISESLTRPLRDLQEDEVWRDAIAGLPELITLGKGAAAIHKYAFTEMLNNAIDHSGGEEALITVRPHDDSVEISIRDDGVGVFEKLSTELGLDMDDVVGELSKGKLTTDPSRHTGEGIFFTSKAVRRFVLESDGRAFIVEGGLDSLDWTVVPSAVEHGTRVTWIVPSAPQHTLNEVFERYASSDDFSFRETHIQVDLFTRQDQLISRSEARRLASRLEEFEIATLDFSGVDAVGQGFADELFRVWAADHPEVELRPVNMAPAVEQMIRRARG
jgi:anti-sigma regulatory factor (Ser/Thr protein kinase)